MTFQEWLADQYRLLQEAGLIGREQQHGGEGREHDEVK
jgi:hypothetical protein